MIDIIRSTNGGVMELVFEECDEGKIQVSMRSKDKRINCSELCGIFGGGGHALAAGIRMTGPLEVARSKVLAKIREAINSSL